MQKTSDEFYMRRALDLAKRAWGDTAPNPMVGAVLVKNGQIIGEGWHKKDGGAHAEIECLRSAKEPPKGAAIYVTLEPCSTHGRTGACSDAIIAAGISSVKIGTLDPNPLHAGRAVEIFRKAQIECESGSLEKECAALNFIFNHAITENSPLVALKYALSADGKIAEIRGRQTAITSETARADVMKYRRLYSAIAVGRGTLESDNPALTSRGFREAEYSPTRLIFDAALNIAQTENPKKFAVFSDVFANLTAVVCDLNADAERRGKLVSAGISVMQIDAPADSAEFWRKLKLRLFQKRITSLYIEGGASLIKSVCDARAADFAFEYRSPKIVGEGGLHAFENGVRPFEIDGEKIALGEDTLTYGKIKWNPKM